MIAATATLTERVDQRDWAQLADRLDSAGIAALGPLLTSDECVTLTALYGRHDLFRSTIDMARHRFGQGQYRYFAHPLPVVIAELRAAFWPHLLPIAREWAARLRQPAPWPDEFDDWIEACHAAGQMRAKAEVLPQTASRHVSGDGVTGREQRAPSLPSFNGALVPHGCDHAVGHRRVGGEIRGGTPGRAPKAGIEHHDRESRLRRRGGTGTTEGTIYNVAIDDSPTSRQNLTTDDADTDA